MALSGILNRHRLTRARLKADEGEFGPAYPDKPIGKEAVEVSLSYY